MNDQISADPLIEAGMFKYPNVTSSGDTVRIIRDRVCPHCHNHCEVLLIHPREAMAPCPMCMGGAARNRSAAAIGQPHWKSAGQAGRCMWEGGYTLEHRYPCVALNCRDLATEPAGFCERHDPTHDFTPPPYPIPRRTSEANREQDDQEPPE